MGKSYWVPTTFNEEVVLSLSDLTYGTSQTWSKVNRGCETSVWSYNGAIRLQFEVV